MFQTIRDKLQGWIAVAVIALIGIPLVLTFGNMGSGPAGANTAARVNGEEIGLVEFQRAYRNQLLARQEEFRGELPAGLEEALKRNTLDTLVLNRALAQHVESAGYRVDSQQLVESIRGFAAFQVAGQFSRPAYEAALANEGLTPTAFEADQRQLLALRQLTRALAESAFYTPGEFRRLLALEGETRRIDYVWIDVRKLAAGVEVSDDDIQAYYEANPGLFQSPESADIEYVMLRLGDMARDFTPGEGDLRQAYDDDPGRFGTGEERRARHILVAVNAQRDDGAAAALAGELAGQLADGGDFAALARQHSDDPGSAARGGDLGWAGQGTYVPPFEEALFALEVGATSPPVRTEFGYHVIRLDEIRPGTQRPYEAVRDELAAELRTRKAQDEYYALAERMDDLALENPGSLDAIVVATGLEIQRINGFTRTGGGVLGGSPALVAAVFGDTVLRGGENTPMIELDEGRAVVARVSRHNPPALRPLAEVRDEVIARVKALRAANEARSRGDALLARVQAGEALDVAAAADGLQRIESGLLDRRSTQLPAEFLAAVFRAPRPKAGTEPVPQGLSLPDGSHAVFMLREAVPGQPEALPRDVRDQRKQGLAQQSGIIETEALARAVRDEASIVVAPGVFDSESGL